jgi:GDP-L-fucose synthase
MNKILITGGSGFIARSLYEDFNNSYFFPLKKNVHSPSRAELDLLDTNKVYDFLKKNKFDIIIHTATYDAAPVFSEKDPNMVLENNLRMFFNITRANSHFGKMIYFGSGAEAGRENWIPKMTEEYIVNHMPHDQYGFSKHVMNKIAEKSENIYNLRIFGLFGKFDDWRYRFISNACCKVVFDMPININKNVRFDYTYINDLIEITKWCIRNKPKYHSYNVCNGEANTYRIIANKILNIASKQLEINIDSEKDIFEYSGDNSRLLKEMNDFSYTSLDNSIKEVYNWYDINKDIIDKDLFAY